jgi:hypothetical protein
MPRGVPFGGLQGRQEESFSVLSIKKTFWKLARKKIGPKHLQTGANPTIVSYNAGAVKMYDVANSIARFYNQITLAYSETF